MAIITIARELGSWGEKARLLLTERMSGMLVDKNVIEGRLQQSGIGMDIINRYDERKPGFFSSFSADQDVYLIYLKAALLEVALEGPVAILGRGANILMNGLPNCLRIRLISPLDVRIRRICEEFKCDEAMAYKLLKKSDSDRSGFCQFHFNSSWSDPIQYDLTINTGKLSDEELVNMICNLAKERFTKAGEDATKVELRNRLLAQKVIQQVLIQRKLPLAFLEADVTGDGVVTLRGATSIPLVAQQAAEAAAEVPGVKQVENNIKVAIELSHGRL